VTVAVAVFVAVAVAVFVAVAVAVAVSVTVAEGERVGPGVRVGDGVVVAASVRDADSVGDADVDSVGDSVGDAVRLESASEADERTSDALLETAPPSGPSPPQALRPSTAMVLNAMTIGTRSRLTSTPRSGCASTARTLLASMLDRHCALPPAQRAGPAVRGRVVMRDRGVEPHLGAALVRLACSVR
jgi:hypothetical protein